MRAGANLPPQLALSLAAKAGRAEANSIATKIAVTANNEKMRFVHNLLFLREVGCTTGRETQRRPHKPRGRPRNRESRTHRTPRPWMRRSRAWETNREASSKKRNASGRGRRKSG